ncbi:hypothetical protein K469DRAFT_182254 [Zopfia rhizophila CBS 207.26]|uniref:Uncharacterized protein n=1 Tax=Zopfia rhizophila CBS 207.26 TaxID=1314779 RepID=A0A6A6DXF5_9PEZI|nr:hypothetical protein K469DRAFT_182254 [Zopfia rhizophila CBS 207.26]
MYVKNEFNISIQGHVASAHIYYSLNVNIIYTQLMPKLLNSKVRRRMYIPCFYIDAIFPYEYIQDTNSAIHCLPTPTLSKPANPPNVVTHSKNACLL